MTYKKKLIEVALPLEAINVASAKEKTIRHGHPSTLHLWWARRPLAACRAVLFGQLVDDPSAHPDRFPTEADQERERQRLFRIIEDLVKWENTTNEEVLEQARAEIRNSCDGNPPPVLDPFCGGGSIPLEAQRLGLEAHGSDLNPVAVLITKALIEIPPKFAGRPPVNPKSRASFAAGGTWRGATGLAEDVRYYGQWMRNQAEERIGHLYPKAKLPDGTEATVIAWLWARTVECPNPACKARMPLVKSFWLSKKPGKQAWVEPIIDREAKTVRFEVRDGAGGPQEPPKTGRGAQFRCLVCQEQCPDQHVKDEGKARRMASQLMAIVAEGDRGRTYLAPTPEQVTVAESATPAWAPTEPLTDDKRAIWCVGYGYDTFDRLFTPRQLVALTTFSDLVGEVMPLIERDAIAAGMVDDGVGLEAGGTDARAYAEAVGVYLGFAVDKMTTTNTSLCTWQTQPTRLVAAFGRQAIPMSWDYAESNPFSLAAGDYQLAVGSLTEVVEKLDPPAFGHVVQANATSAPRQHTPMVVTTDPPYYDNIGYADLSDWFYVWQRRALGPLFPGLFGPLLTPKTEELIAAAHRHPGGKLGAARFFEEGLGHAFAAMRQTQDIAYPFVVYYAFKQEEGETSADGRQPVLAIASTGWETMLAGLLDAGFRITGTWPMRTELVTSLKKSISALASSIVLVCRPRPEDAPTCTRREFLAALRAELPDALRNLQQGNIAPVDFAQAAIGPGMGVFSRYAKVLEADGGTMGVRTALQIINQELDAFLAEQEGDVDPDTRFCIAWYEQYGLEEADFGGADVLARAKNTSVSGLADSGVLHSAAGKVRLRSRPEYPDDWDPRDDARVPVWEAAQHLVRALEQGGEIAASGLATQLGSTVAEEARALAYRLFSICTRKGWAQEALAYNGLVIAWPEIMKLRRETAADGSLFD